MDAFYLSANCKLDLTIYNLCLPWRKLSFNVPTSSVIWSLIHFDSRMVGRRFVHPTETSVSSCFSPSFSLLA
jgi:hypothetical protein